MRVWIATAAVSMMASALLASPGSAQPEPEIHQITWISGVSAVNSGNKALRTPFPLRLAAFIESRWPETKHIVISSNALRAVKMLTDGEQGCVLDFAHTAERERFAYFSDALLEPPPEVIIRRGREQDLPRNEAGEVILERLLANKDLRGAVVRGRSYGKAVDAQLDAAPPSGGLTRYAAIDFGSNMLAMVRMGRIDYTLVRDVTTEFESGGIDPATDALVDEPIEGINTPQRGGVACPRTPWGLKVIQRIDAILSTPEGVSLTRGETERGMTPAAKRRFASEINALYEGRSRSADR